MARHANPNAASDISNGNKKTTIVVFTVILIGLLIAAGIGLGYVIWTNIQMENAKAEMEGYDIPVTPDGGAIVNPINFEELQAENPDIYAWLYIPGTDINLPLVQSPDHDNYYLDHTVDGEESIVGAVYSQRQNSLDFTDPVTVFYGHTLNNGGMFTQLHAFEDKDFFDQNRVFYIYTPDSVLTYDIISAANFSNLHIMNVFDFSNPEVVETYFDYVTTPSEMSFNVEDNVQIDLDGRIVQLSTCTVEDNSSLRYIVTGLLIDEQSAIPA